MIGGDFHKREGHLLADTTAGTELLRDSGRRIYSELLSREQKDTVR
jgi:hypothetical protein